MGLSWQQAPLSSGPVGRFLTAEPLPDRLLFAEPLRRRMRARHNGVWVADSEDVVLLHEPGHYPVAFFPVADVADGVLENTERRTKHRELGETSWYTLVAGGERKERAAWSYTSLPEFADILANRVAFAWRAVDEFFEEDERILGHAADPYHRIDIRSTSRHLQVKQDGRIIANTYDPLALYESGFAPRWYVNPDDVVEHELTPVDGQTFCPYKGLAEYFAIGGVKGAAWSYPHAMTEVDRVAGWISFEPDLVEVYIDGVRQSLAAGQLVTAHGLDRGLDAEEVNARRKPSGLQDTDAA